MGSRSPHSSAAGGLGRVGVAATLGVALALSGLAGLAGPAAAVGADAQYTGYLESTVRFLQEAQNPDGGFGATPGGPSDSDISAWAAIGLAAAGINPQQQARPGGRSVYTYLTEHAGELSLTTDFERALLVADAAGTSPHDFGGVDLVSRILERKLPEGVPDAGAFKHEANEATVQDVSDTVFAILALSPIHEPEVQGAVQKATEWLIEQQSESGPSRGSWNATCLPSVPACIGPEGEGAHGEVDMTAAAIEALNAAGDHDSEAPTIALEFLQGAQSSDGGDGGFPEFFPHEPGEAPANAGLTSWAVQALWSAGENPEAEAWRVGGGANPLEFLASLQRPNGAISYLPDESQGSLWMTAYTTTTLAGRWLPVPVPPPQPPPASTSPAPPVSSSVQLAPARVSRPVEKSGHRKGVIVGGGGRGARLFSRPRPGGQGAGHAPLRESQSVNPTSESATTEQQPAASARHARAHHSRRSPSRPRGAQEADAPQSGSRVTGLLLDEPLAARAPGLRSAATEAAGSWTTTAILVGLALLVVAGTRLERRRPRTRDRAQVGT